MPLSKEAIEKNKKHASEKLSLMLSLSFMREAGTVSACLSV